MKLKSNTSELWDAVIHNLTHILVAEEETERILMLFKDSLMTRKILIVELLSTNDELKQI
jgi:hypothetical protein